MSRDATKPTRTVLHLTAEMPRAKGVQVYEVEVRIVDHKYIVYAATNGSQAEKELPDLAAAFQKVATIIVNLLR